MEGWVSKAYQAGDGMSNSVFTRKAPKPGLWDWKAKRKTDWGERLGFGLIIAWACFILAWGLGILAVIFMVVRWLWLHS